MHPCVKTSTPLPLLCHCRLCIGINSVVPCALSSFCFQKRRTLAIVRGHIPHRLCSHLHLDTSIYLDHSSWRLVCRNQRPAYHRHTTNDCVSDTNGVQYSRTARLPFLRPCILATTRQSNNSIDTLNDMIRHTAGTQTGTQAAWYQCMTYGLDAVLSVPMSMYTMARIPIPITRSIYW